MKRRKPRPGPGDRTLDGDKVFKRKWRLTYNSNPYENTGRIDPDLFDGSVEGTYLRNTGTLHVGYGMSFPPNEVYV